MQKISGQSRDDFPAGVDGHHPGKQYSPEDEQALPAYVTLDRKGYVLTANSGALELFRQRREELIHQPLQTFVGLKDQMGFQVWLSELDQKGHADSYLLHLQPTNDQDKSIVRIIGTRMETADENAVFLLNLRLVAPTNGTGLNGHQDNGHQKKQQLYKDLYRASSRINGTLDDDLVLKLVLTTVNFLVPYTAADLMLVKDTNATIVYEKGYKALGLAAVPEGRKTVSLDYVDVLSQMYLTREPLLHSDIDDDALLEIWYGNIGNIRSYLGIPLEHENKVIGFLNLLSDESGRFTESDATRLNLFSAQVAQAICNAKAHTKALKSAATDERHRLARELHDSVNQMLFSSSMISETLVDSSEDTAQPLAEMREYISHIHRLNRGALAQMRLLLMEYRPEFLVDVDLPTQLRRLVDAIQGRENIEVSLIIDDGHPSPPDVRLALYRIAQESLNNIAKHARADHAHVKLTTTESIVELRVSDSGVGFDPDGKKGIGLSNIYERAEAIDAKVSLKSYPGDGTEIQVLWQREQKN